MTESPTDRLRFLAEHWRHMATAHRVNREAATTAGRHTAAGLARGAAETFDDCAAALEQLLSAAPLPPPLSPSFPPVGGVV